MRRSTASLTMLRRVIGRKRRVVDAAVAYVRRSLLLDLDCSFAAQQTVAGDCVYSVIEGM